MELLQTLFFTAIALGVLVTFHEFGHFWVARKCGVKVIRFSVGFGTALAKWRDKQGTEFVIAALPLGGYVKMVDEREGNVAAEDLSCAFNRKSVWKRMAIVLAGPVANFLLAIAAYWLVFLNGVQGLAPIVGQVEPGSIAAIAGVQSGDEIVAVDGQETESWQALREQLIYRIGESGELNISVKQGTAQDVYELQAPLDRWLSDAAEIDPLEGLGIRPFQPQVKPIADAISPDSPSEKSGLKAGDEIVQADGAPMNDWETWVDYVRARPGQEIQIVYLRDGTERSAVLVPESVEDASGDAYGQVGMAVLLPEWPEDMIRTREFGVIEAFGAAVTKTGETSVMILDSIKKMLEGLISAKHLSGPITIAKVAGTSAQYGFVAYISFIAFLSVSLGVLNLLPIPVLDGGHLLYYIVEAIKGSPVSEKIQMAGFRIGVVLVVGLMVIAFYNDLMRI
ncbi:MAG: RIP metalloprotease RseP [bacterium]